jgi:hypothetical protein
MLNFSNMASPTGDPRERVLNAARSPSPADALWECRPNEGFRPSVQVRQPQPHGAGRTELPTAGWLTERELSQIIGFSLSRLRQDRHRHRGIPYSKVNRAVRYAAEDVERFMRAHRITPDAMEV